MSRLPFRTFLFFCLLVCCQMVLAGSSPPFWRVTDNDSSVHLLGSIHFGDETLYPLPVQVEQAFRNADALAVEVDLTRISAESMASTVRRFAALPQSTTLSEQIGPSLYKKLSDFCRVNGLPEHAFQHWQPWFVALQLVQMELAQSSWSPAWGVDQYFLNNAEMPVLELETLDYQLSILAGFSSSEQRLFLRQTLDDLSQSNDYLNAMSKAWQVGRTAELETLMLDAFVEGDDSQAIFKKMFVDRNHEMTTQIKQFLRDNRNVFVVVGAGHMLGDSGIIERLRKQGYRIERVSY